MRYMRLNADWVSTKNSSALVKNGYRLFEIGKNPMNASDGDAFCLLDCEIAGMPSGKVWLPISEGEDADVFKGKDINGGEAVIPVGNNPVFASFQDALTDALWDYPVATATIHASSMILKAMPEEKFEELSIDKKMEIISSLNGDDLTGMAMDTMLETPLSPVETDEINKIISETENSPKL